MNGYKAVSYLSIGLPHGPLDLRPGDFVPPSFLIDQQHQVNQWVSDGNVVLVADAPSAELKKAEARAAPSESSR